MIIEMTRLMMSFGLENTTMNCSTAYWIRPTPRAFTLVELLVVIGIIALLISILLPALNKARQHAVTAACLSNLHQMGISLMMYQQDNKGVDPGENGSATWMLAIGKYIAPNWFDPQHPPVNYAATFALPPTSFAQQLAACAQFSPKVWFCPQAPLANAQADTTGQAVSGGGSWGTTTIPWGPGTEGNMYYLCGSYGMNGFIYNLNNSIQNYGNGAPEPAYWSGMSGQANYANYFVNPKYTQQSSNTPTFFDSNWHEAYPCNFLISGFPSVDQPPNTLQGVIGGCPWTTANPPVQTANKSQMCRICMARHGPAVNVAFMDGHAQTEPLAQLWGLQWSPLSIRRPCPSPIPHN
jgi:prepilin-type N-terminal cleavage/methylation domain-containing protein/prepilin-type processing-associated H-X9-DG protein